MNRRQPAPLVRVLVAAGLLLLALELLLCQERQELGTPPTFPRDLSGLQIPAGDRAGVLAELPLAATPQVNPQNREQSRVFYNSYYLGAPAPAINWTGNRSTCAAGTTALDFRDTVVLRVNYFRAMAGVPSQIALSDTYSGKGQQSALMMSVNGQLNHNPPSSWTCYTAEGAEAAGKSNLALGAYGWNAISLYIQDPGDSNGAAGHRRWILYPQTQIMGSGDIPSTGGWASNDLWVFDDHIWDVRPPTREEFVAWPPPGYVPYPVVFPRWSFSYPSANFSQASVSMLRDQSSISVTMEAVANGYGENTLVWRPEGMPSGSSWPKPASDVVYRVTISNVLIGGNPRSFTYDVTVMDPAVSLTQSTQNLIDFDNDNRTDPAVWRQGSGVWYSLLSNSPGSSTSMKWGLSTDIPVPADYDGDGKTDVAVWRPGGGVWYILPSSSPGTYITRQWGMFTDKPFPGDFDGDGKADVAVWRPGTGVWYVLPSGTPGSFTSTQWGLSGDVSVPSDYDGDGKTDVAVWRPGTGTWYIVPSLTPSSYTGSQWGMQGDVPVPSDYDGDGKADIAVWRPSTGTWYVLPSGTPGTLTARQWGARTDTVVPGDYDGDGKADISVWRPSNGVWYVIPSSSQGTYTATQWGMEGDVPLSTITRILGALP